MRAPGLSLVLPGCVTWKRPRRIRGLTRYPGDYARDRDAWALVVAYAVAETGWATPPVKDALAVEAEVVAGGKFDLDRVGTAILDALQGGGAIKDDCRVWELMLRRRRPARGEDEKVLVLLGYEGDGHG